MQTFKHTWEVIGGGARKELKEMQIDHKRTIDRMRSRLKLKNILSRE